MSRKAKELTVEVIPGEVRGIAYDYAGKHYWLTGSFATIYRWMIWLDGKEKATAEFWEMFHKKENSTATPNDAVPAI